MWPGWDHVYLGLSPGEETIVHRSRKLPDGLLTACAPSDSGYVAEVAIPVTFLNEKQDGAWDGIRLNVNQIRVDNQGESGIKAWWQPNWSEDANRVGTGLFERAH